MCKAITTIAFCFIYTFFCQAQINAITEMGDKVMLYEDGTWQYADDSTHIFTPILTNPTIFSKSKSADFLLKSNKTNIGFWLDSQQWRFQKATSSAAAEYELELKKGDLYGMVISEKIEIPLETLQVIALENAQKVSPDIHIVRQEYRQVNGLKILMLQMDGTLQGIKFSYYGYYYSSSEGSVQFVCYTAQSLLEQYIPEIEDLLNGLVQTNE